MSVLSDAIRRLSEARPEETIAFGHWDVTDGSRRRYWDRSQFAGGLRGKEMKRMNMILF